MKPNSSYVMLAVALLAIVASIFFFDQIRAKNLKKREEKIASVKKEFLKLIGNASIDSTYTNSYPNNDTLLFYGNHALIGKAIIKTAFNKDTVLFYRNDTFIGSTVSVTYDL